ncbi:MAG: protein sphX [Nitrospirae bacterium CG08_land_8_20_14_0_20_52_24]|nr:MAG: protein sphX [Nitrospirae bacterium CG08_land_8_20_14_0_20_52_24]PIW85673.1 MAG: protein sphX [Nitrospirae bacterium CG_4_8_14_3_um_filter_50_41]PIX84618.1 MAG: protein sphX [Nitrospirae bacterium CG_4_10_14_3_um_filter_53_41]
MIKKIVFGMFALMVLSMTYSMPAVAADKLIKIDGSSTVYPITEAVAEEYQKAKRGEVKVTVGISGTGGGFKKFCRGETDISDASRPILKKEIDACNEQKIEYIELPVAYDGLAVIVNPKNTWVSSLTVADLKKMWEPAAQGKVTKWNQVKPEWPDASLKLFGPGADSGTFDYFTEAVVGKSKSSRGDFTASEDDNVLVQGIAGDKNALGYFGLAYYEENKSRLKIVPIVNPATNKEVTPSLQTVMDGTYSPLSRPLFIYINKKSLEKPEVKEFVDYYQKNADTLTRQVKYVPLPANAYKLAQERFAKMKTGSMFGGEEKVGMKIEELLKLEEAKK